MAPREPVRSSPTITVLRQAFWLCLILASLHLLSITAKSQITLVRIVKNKVKLELPTNEVTFIRKDKRPPVIDDMKLEIGDKLYSESRSIKLHVKCNGADYYYTPPLSIKVLKPTAAGCFMGYSSRGGKINVISRNTPTNNHLGYAAITSRTTEYEIRMVREERNWLARFLLFRFPRFVRLEALVYEGDVNVTSRRFSETVKQGQRMIVSNRGTPIIASVTPIDLREAAMVYAEFDVSQIPTPNAAERERAFQRLVALHEAVLRERENDQRRIDLNRELKNLGIPQADLRPSPSPPIQTPPAEKAENREAKNLGLPEARLRPSPSPPIQTPPAEKAQSQSNEWTKGEFAVMNRCKKPHEFRIRPYGSFLHEPFSVEITVLPGATYKGQFEFDLAGRGPGVYDGAWFIECLDCHREPRCKPVKQALPFKLKK